MLSRKAGRLGFYFSLPTIVFFFAFLAIPIFFTFYLSFTNWSGFDFSQIKFSGITNYINVLSDKIFHKAFYQTCIFVVLRVTFLNIFGFIVALIIDQKVPGSKFLRSVIFIPCLLSPIIIGVMWSRMFDAFGIINQLLEYLHLIKLPIMWLGSPNLSLYTVIIASVWQWTGFNTLLYYSGLQTIPNELVEAAKVDGASFSKIVFKIYIPLLEPVITIAALLNLIAGFREFDLVYVMTRGGPNHSSDVLATLLYQNAFMFNKMGSSSVIAVVIVILCTIFSILRLKTSKE
ncbi:MAG: sugar ABC transporter permease [Actinobacteria bacterium]|nr:sugar ABC transporter permease [Actinomycetota bacterium]